MLSRTASAIQLPDNQRVTFAQVTQAVIPFRAAALRAALAFVAEDAIFLRKGVRHRTLRSPAHPSANLGLAQK